MFWISACFFYVSSWSVQITSLFYSALVNKPLKRNHNSWEYGRKNIYLIMPECGTLSNPFTCGDLNFFVTCCLYTSISFFMIYSLICTSTLYIALICSLAKPNDNYYFISAKFEHDYIYLHSTFWLLVFKWCINHK